MFGWYLMSYFAILYYIVMALNISQHVSGFGSGLQSNPSGKMELQTKLVRKQHGISMKWLFGKIPGSGSFKDFGGVGTQGELYFVPQSKPALKAPDGALGKKISIPIFPRNQVLGPMGEDFLLVYEMRYRQLFNDVGDGGLCGHIFYSQENSRVALVGTLAKVLKLERLDDGGMYVVLQGVGRFYVREVISDKPYMKAKVQIFYDYCDSLEMIETLALKVFNELRYSVKIMKLLYPSNNYTISEACLQYQPSMSAYGIRTVQLPSDVTDSQRHSKFSFGAIEMMKTDPQTKLVFIQEHVLERRYSKMIKILQETTNFVENELLKKGLHNEESIKTLREDLLKDKSDLVMSSQSDWTPQNFVDGDWRLQSNQM